MNILTKYMHMLAGADPEAREAVILLSNVDRRLTPALQVRVLDEVRRQNYRDVSAEWVDR